MKKISKDSMENAINPVVEGEKIVVQGAREHNLKNVSVEFPRNKLVVISGLSGSGKSSLAFDTLFAEGQRRYMESLSSYARQFLGRMDKPDVDLISGLSPAISIEQKTTHKNPRSTVGTVTEIYDYYRLLFARIGRAHCPKCGREIKEQSVDQIIDTILSWDEGTKLTLLSPVIRGKKGEHVKIIDDAKKSGFVRARIDGLMVELENSIKLDKQKKTNIIDSLGCTVPEIVPTQQMRQERFDNWELTDDHDMHIYGIAKDQNGKEYYMVKNSWGETGDYKGTWYMTKAFIAANTMDFLINKNAIPAEIRKKLGI